MAFKKATKEQARLRLALFGPSGAGKTMTALRIAQGIGGKIALIDTERGSASKYADRFVFDVDDLAQKSIAGYLGAMKEAASAKYEVLIIDSLSHAWQELLTEIDKLAKSKFKGNTWSAWSEGTPKQKQLVEAILDYPGHVIVTMRSKTEWVQEQSDSGKTRPVRVGLAPEQGKGIEYEFDLLIELSTDHIGTILKDRTGKYQDIALEKPGEEFGKELAAWLADGVSFEIRETERRRQEQIRELKQRAWRVGIRESQAWARWVEEHLQLAEYYEGCLEQADDAQFSLLWDRMEIAYNEAKTKAMAA